MVWSTKGLLLPTLVIALSLLMACSDETPMSSEAVRAIKSITVTERADGQPRRYSGVVEPSDTASISFQVPGNVQKVNVDVGDRVSKGDILSLLDDSTFHLKVEAAEASLGRAEAELTDAKRNWERFQQVAQGAVAARTIDQAEAEYHSARQNLSYVNSRLNLARRDLEEAVLRAPFDGIVAERLVNSFQEVARGERVFELNREGAMEAAISIPESEISQVYLGLPAEIRVPAVSTETFSGVVSEVGKVAGAANAFPVRVAFDDADGTDIRAGVTANVTLILGVENSADAYLVPLRALVPGEETGTSFIFVFDTDSSTVSRTPIESSGIRDNDVVVNRGVRAGDIVAVAGVSFLRDGQEVRLMER